jgi:hypothetical protein
MTTAKTAAMEALIEAHAVELKRGCSGKWR